MRRECPWVRTVALVSLAAVLTSCVLVNPTDPYRPVHVSANGPGAVRVGVAASQPASVSRLTLQRCIALAEEHNPDVARAGWEVAAAHAGIALAAGERWPTVHARGTYTHTMDSQRLIPPRSPTDLPVFSRNVFAGDLVLRLPLFTGGRITSAIAASKLLEEAAARRLARTREELVFNVSSVFYGILAQRQIVRAIDFSTKALEEHRERVRHLIDVQRAARVDLLRTEVRLADLRQRRVAEANRLAILKRVLVNLMGIRAPGDSLAVDGRLALRPANIDRDESLRRALSHRADYLAARAELEAQARRVDVARAARWPTVNLEGSYGVRHAASPTSQPSGVDSTEDVGYIGVTAEIPLFEGGRIGARIRRERYALAAAQERLRTLELQIRLDVETAVLDVEAGRARVAATEEAITQARESLRIEREKYAVGRSSQTDVLDAQSALVDAETAYYRALADYETALAEWALAVGDE